MAIIAQQQLFSWEDVEARSDLDRLKFALDSLPDKPIIDALEKKRGNGRNDYPVAPMWNALIAAIVFQHNSIESLRRELSRNPALLKCCGFNILPLPCKKTDEEEPASASWQVPSASAFTHFMQSLIDINEVEDLISDMVKSLRESLMEVLPDFGQHLGFDGKSIQSHSTGQKDSETQKTSDPTADWGKHETQCVNHQTGQSYKKIKSWFGFGLHLIADTQYEIPVAFELTRASCNESPVLRRMIRELFEDTPQLSKRCKDFCADRGLDAGETKAMLLDDYNIRPIIDTRLMWGKDSSEDKNEQTPMNTRPLYVERVDTILYTERGTVHCRCPESGELREMAFKGFESDRGTLKYQCPAAAYDFECKGLQACHQSGNVKAGEHGRIVRIKLEDHDRRIFTPTPHGSPTWNRAYNRRSALERINNRIDNNFGFETHYVRGLEKMKVRAGLAIGVMMAMALGSIKAKQPERMRSLVKPVSLAA